MSSRLPSVLVISPCTFNFLNGGGVTFSNLFSEWPKEKLSNLHASQEPEDHGICGRFFRMGPTEIRRAGAFLPSGGGVPAGGSTGTGEPSRWRRLLAGNSGWPEKFCLSPALESWLQERPPEIIYTILGPIPFLEAVLEIKRKFGSRLVVHHMDDWYPNAYTTGLFRFQRTKMLRLFHEILEGADLRFTICDAMSEEYHRRFGKAFRAFQNAVDVDQYTSRFRGQRMPVTRSLLYYGSVYPFAQLDALRDGVQAVASLRARGEDVHLRVVCPPAHAASLFAGGTVPAGISLEKMTNDPEQFFREIAGASALFLPANFDATSAEFLRFSMPTKLPGYLASGKPILVYSPPSLAQARYALEKEWGIVVRERDQQKLEQGVLDVLNPEKSAPQASSAARLARERHDLPRVRSEFQELLRKLGH